MQGDRGRNKLLTASPDRAGRAGTENASTIWTGTASFNALWVGAPRGASSPAQRGRFRSNSGKTSFSARNTFSNGRPNRAAATTYHRKFPTRPNRDVIRLMSGRQTRLQ